MLSALGSDEGAEVGSPITLPFDEAAELLFSEQSAVRFIAVRSLGMKGLHLEALEVIAERDECPEVGMIAACWLAINGRLCWLDHLQSLSESLESEALRVLAADLCETARAGYLNLKPIEEEA